MMGLKQIMQQLTELADPHQAAHLQRFFKTGPGEYGEGDRFLGIRVARLRQLAKANCGLSLAHTAKLLHSRIHERRMLALLILTYRYPKAQPDEQEAIYRFFLANTPWINNWDLVDVTVPRVVGAHLLERGRKPLYDLAVSRSLWERRIAILATAWFIRHHQLDDTLKIAGLLINDKEDLIHKAVGWMLREVGKRDQAVMEDFLIPRYAKMPRTMLRYAIEKLPELRRQAYLKGTV
jgi:3-methyladenine DNA glycosylase AlkD